MSALDDDITALLQKKIRRLENENERLKEAVKDAKKIIKPIAEISRFGFYIVELHHSMSTMLTEWLSKYGKDNNG